MARCPGKCGHCWEVCYQGRHRSGEESFWEGALPCYDADCLWCDYRGRHRVSY